MKAPPEGAEAWAAARGYTVSPRTRAGEAPAGPPVAPKAIGRTHALFLPGWRPAPLNTLLGHWSKAQRRKKADRAVIEAAVFLHGTPAATGPRQVEVYLLMGKGQRSVDPDASWKSLLDALAHAGAIVNDSPAWCRIESPKYLRCLHGAPEGAFVVLTDL